MKVILKPIGLICIIGAFGLLTAVAFFRNNNSNTALPVVTTGNNMSVNKSVPPATRAATTTATSLPPGVLLMPDIASDEWQNLIGNGKSDSAIVDSTVAYHPHARRLTTTAAGTHPWDLQLAHPLNVALKGGKKIRLTFWARSKDSCPLTAVVEQNAEPYTRVVSQDVQLTPNWQQYTAEWVQTADTTDKWAKMDFQYGQKIGEIELTGVTIHEVD